VACQREDGALWVRALDDPVAIQYFNRASEDLSAISLHALYGRVNVADVEVIKPAGNRHRRRFSHHATDRLPAGGELLICAHRADISFRFLPTKELAVNGPCLLLIVGQEFVPAGVASCAQVNGLLITGALPLEQRKRCHLWVRDN
jgi:hypothetical protein